ncbi:hypothetical protein BD413DRAFT_484537 [Trametes elegans]|nr:hypothetical protein BD413DRAFT_484537 [Trametes elegans]
MTNDFRVIRSLSMVSHEFRAVAIKRLLSMRPIHLDDVSSVWQLHRCTSGDPGGRYPYVRQLCIDLTEEIDEDEQAIVAEKLLEILQRSTNLQSLELPNPQWTYETLDEDRRIVKAIIQLNSLQNLALEGWFPPMERIIRTIRSQPKRLCVSLDGLATPDGEHWIDSTQLDGLLAHIAPTLEDLDIRDRSFNPAQKGAVYPAMRSVMLRCGEDVVPRTDVLVHKFPALDGTLDIGHLIGDLMFDEEERLRLRAENRQRQADERWVSLDRVVGDAFALQVLGLACPVRHIMVDDLYLDYKDALADVLRDTPPTHLKLSIRLQDGIDMFEDLLPLEVVPRLTHLVLRVMYENPSTDDGFPGGDADTIENISWDVFLSTLISCIEHLRLTHLRLVVDFDVDLTTDTDRPEPPPYSKDFVRSIRELDHGPTAEALAEAVPTLQQVFIMSGGAFDVNVLLPGSPPPDSYGDFNEVPRTRGRRFVSSGWRRVGGGGKGKGKGKSVPQSLARFGEEDMEDTLRAEALILSTIDEYSLGLNRKWAPEEVADWDPPE